MESTRDRPNPIVVCSRTGGRAVAEPEPPKSGSGPPPPGAVLFDRHGSLLRSLCARSSLGPAFPALRRSLDLLRRIGVPVAVASHNRGRSWGRPDVDEIAVAHDRIEPVLGPIDLWCICLIEPDGQCACDCPGDGVLETAARTVGVAVQDCAVATGGPRLASATVRVGATTLLPPGSDSTRGQRQPEDEATELVRVVDTAFTEHPPGPTTALRHLLVDLPRD
jgi:D-glycero-D-manno-heptose 1,7-bisphosphate phosphatase